MGKSKRVIKVATVKYANSYPMNWGLLKGPVSDCLDISFDHPAGIARQLLEGRAEIGLLPIAAIPDLEQSFITGDYCIGATGRVRTVMLLSNSPVTEINTIWLDHRSVTSVRLAKVLGKFHWKRDFMWMNPGPGFNYGSVSAGEGIVIIGDQCFEMEKRFSYGYDLAEEWKRFSGLPFVFACWVSVSEPDSHFAELFNQSLLYGIQNIEKAVSDMASIEYPGKEEIINYLKTNIDYPLDREKRKAIDLFLSYLKSI